MIKDFNTYISEGLFDRNQSEFNIRKTDKGIEQIYAPKTNDELYKYIELDIEKAKKDGTYPDVNLNNIDVSELGDDDLKGLFGDNYPLGGIYDQINPDISNWNIKYIPSSFFYGNRQIKEFTIPDSFTDIGESAFAGCSSLTSVMIGNSVTYIEDGAFSDCKSLASVTIGNSVTDIGEWAFYVCDKLTSVEIPNSVTSIRGGSFCRCVDLTSVTIGNSVTDIGAYAFNYCTSLKSVEIPKHCNIDATSFHKNCKIIRRDD